MPEFLKLHTPCGNRVLINWANVTFVWLRDDGGCRLHFNHAGGHNCLCVREGFHTIVKKLQEPETDEA